jgi:hypothetical protein
MTPSTIAEAGAKIELAWVLEYEKYVTDDDYSNEVTALVLYTATRFITNFIKNLNISDERSISVLEIFNETNLKMLKTKLETRRIQKEVH